MATLRDPFFAPNTVSIDEMQQLQDADKGSLRRGWEAGRIGSERNALGIDEVAARAAGDIQRAETLRMQNDALGQAQARVAPQIQKVEDINWEPGKALNWFGGAVGQGLASTVEPVAAATALGGIGRVAGMLPGTAGKVGRAIGTVGAPAAAFGINQRQMAGEFANNAMQDQELMARTSPQDLYQTANIVGGVAGAADTVLPAIIGRQFTGAGLRAGMKAMGAGMGPAVKTVLGMGGETITELSQGEVGRYALGQLNPNRDTSEDASNRLNEAAGGAAGGGPLIAAGAYADAGYRRVGQAADMVGTKTGEMVDLAKEKYDGSALQGGVDKAMAAGKQKAGDMVDLLDHVRGDDGKVSLTKMADLVEGARDSANELVQRYKVSDEERDLLNLTPPAGIAENQAEHDAWLAGADDQRLQFVGGRLNDMAEADPRAADILDRMAAAQSRDEQVTIADEGAKLILETNEIEQLASRGERAAAAMGEMASKGASALGKGAVAVGKGAMKFGKAVFDGAAAEARKKNAQGAPDTSYEAWKARRDEMRGGALPIDDQVKRQQVGNRALDTEAIKNDPATAAAKLRSRRRAELYGEILEAEARSARAISATRADPAVEEAFGLITRHAGFELADIAESWGMKGPKQQGSVGLAAGTRQTPALTMALDRIANSLRVALRDRATPALDQLQAQADQSSAPLFDYVRERIASSGTPAGRKAAEAVRTNVANELMMLVPTERRTEIMRSEAGGGKLNRAWLLESVEALANGHESPKFRATLDEAFGKEIVDEMIGRLNTAGVAPGKLMRGTVATGEESLVEATVNEDGEYEAETTETSDFDKRQAEKKVAKGSGPKVYGFANQGIQSLRGSTDRRDPFAPLTKMTAKQKREFDAENERRIAEGLEPLTGAPVKRPGLFKLDDQLSDDTEAELVPDGKGGLRRPTKLEHKLAQMAKATQRYEDDEDSGPAVSARSALEVMKDLGFQPAKILSVYRDYMLQDAGNEKLPAGARAAARTVAGKANRAVLDAMDQADGKKGLRLQAGARKQIKEAAEAYFKERFVAVAEEPGDAVPNRIEVTELLNMGRAGAKVISVARRGGAEAAEKALESGSTEAQAEGVGKDAEHAVLDDANLITFQSDLLKNKDRGLHIKADTLVKWVQAQRNRNETKDDAKDDYSNRSKNQAYLTDLLEGIAAVVDSGMVDTNKVYNPKNKKHEARMAATRINAEGEYEAFITDPKTEERTRKDGSTVDVPVYPKGSPNGVPASLRLVTSTYGDMEYGKEERTKARPKAEGPPKPESDPTSDQYQGAVDQDQARNEEFFVADPLEGLEPEPTYTSVDEPRTFVSPNADRARRTTTYADRPTFSTGSRARKGSELAGSKKERDALEAQYEEERKAREERSDAAGKSAGESPAQRDARRARLAESERSRVAERSVQSAARARALGTADAKTDGDDAAPLDFFPRQKAGAVPDEFADQQFRTTKKAADVAVGPENKMSAMAKAPERGAEIARTLNKDFAAGVAMIESRLRSAQRPEFIADEKARETSAVGGQHYVMPLAYALNADTIGKLDLGPAEAKKLTALRGEAAKIILLADKLKENQKVALTKAMAPATSADKVNLANYAKLLQKASEPTTPAPAAPAPAPAPASGTGTGLLAKTLKARLEYLNNPPTDYTTAKTREIDAWAKRQLERINEAIKGVDESSERYEALDEARFTAKQLVKKAASVLEGDASLTEFEGSAAPEVANAGLPKSRPKPSGAEGRTAPAEFTNHSGGALGADSMFDKVGRSLGFTKHNHYYHGIKTPFGNVALTRSQVDEGIVHAKRAAAVLARPWNDKYASLLGRNWFQVKNASQVIAVAPLVEPGELNEKGYASRAKRTTVGGGTGYAVEMAIANGKEVRVFDTKSNQWFAWDGQGFVESGVPALAKDYAGIGSRQDYGRMTPESVQAIRDVFEKALASKTDLWADTGARKLSAMSSEIHNDLGRGGFAATHDSPIRHEGKFNWREHTGKGEGNAMFGAGTYLSTGDKVHNYYKKLMTEKAKYDAVVTVDGRGFPTPWNEVSSYHALPAAEKAVMHALHNQQDLRGQALLDAAIEDAAWQAGNVLDETVDDVSYYDLAPEVMKEIEAAAGHKRNELTGELIVGGDVDTTTLLRLAQTNNLTSLERAVLGYDRVVDIQTEIRRLDPARFRINGAGPSPTYHVSVNAMKAQLLNWDKPLSEQSSYVKKRLEGLKGQMAESIAADLDGGTYDARLAYATEKMNGAPGNSIYGFLTARLGSQAAASDYLQSLGILGHEYAASNGRDGKTPNYVIYDDSKITTNYVHFNRQGGNARVASQAEMDEAKAYVRKVLGPQIKVEFKDITGYAGEWLDAEQAIQISTTAAPGVLHTAYHEALHGFFSKFVKNDPRALDVLRSLAENDKILARVAALLAGHPAAIDQLKSGEERLAYIYQFWAAGKLDLPMGKPRTMLQKVRKFFRRVLGLVKDSERAVALFEAFHGGQLAEPSAAGKVIARVLDEGTGVLKARRSMDGLTQWLAAKTMPAETVLATSESKAAQALAKEFFTNPGDEDAGKEAEGYLNARRRVAARYNNTFAQAIRGLSDRDLTEVAKLLQGEAELADIPYAPHREAVGKIRGLLQRFYKYMSDERGLELGHAGDKYFPRVWNTHLLHEKKDQFVQMLATHYDAVLEQGAQGSKGKLSKEQVAERIWRALVDREGVNDKLDAQRQDGVLAPFFASKENRTLAWLSGEHAQPFLEKNLVATLSRYFHQGVRAAEYTDRFGADGAELEAKLMEIQGELTELSMAKLQRKEFKDDAARAKWVSRQYRDVAEAVGAMEGTLGKDVSPTVRKLNSWVTVYQNVRLLPLSLFASFVDPLGMVARGATMKEAYDAFLRGMKEVTSNWGDMFREEPKERQADQWEKLAEHVGAVDAALFAHHVSDEYSSVYMERGAKTINDTMFKLNGMEAWNRGMRVAGVKSAVAFIERHAGGADKIHSTRWLEELGLDPKNIPLDTEGKLITDKSVLMQQKGMGKSQAEREIDAVHYAINRWVEGAILTPNAAQRPAWGSDPHYSMFFHLKQFSYSFHQTILKRAVKEMNHGNLAPMGAFVWYIPTMIAADITKGLIQGGGELPAYMKGMDLGDHIMRATQRAGVLGVGQIGVDASEDMFSLAGPGVEQMIDAMRDPLSETTIKALPAHGIYAQALR